MRKLYRWKTFNESISHRCRAKISQGVTKITGRLGALPDLAKISQGVTKITGRLGH
jgi:hypothetical protein